MSIRILLADDHRIMRDGLRSLLKGEPDMQVVVLSLHSDRRLVTSALKAGASAYLLKDCAFEELTGAIRAVVANQTYLSPGITSIVIEDYVRHSQAPDSSAFSALTARQREVAQLLSEGKTTKQIALCLNISVKTVETYRHQIMDKLHIRSIAELTKYALREGLTSLET